MASMHFRRGVPRQLRSSHLRLKQFDYGLEVLQPEMELLEPTVNFGTEGSLILAPDFVCLARSDVTEIQLLTIDPEGP